jgi:hypothetical protein
MAGAVVSCPPATSPIFRPPRESVCERQPSLERLAKGWLITLLPVAFACMRQKTANSCHSSVRLPVGERNSPLLRLSTLSDGCSRL